MLENKMTQGFDEWLKTKKIGTDKHGVDYVNGFARAAHCGWLARQAEIDELQKKYDAMYNAFVVIDEARQEWYRCYMGVRQREDELQKRIDAGVEESDVDWKRLKFAYQAMIGEHTK